MKPTLLILLVFLAVPLFDLAQSPCPEAQKYIDKRKAEEQKGKTIINAPLECYSDWAMYYALRCKCEQGVESNEEAKKLADKVNAKRKYLIRLEKTECNLGEGVPGPVTSCQLNGNTNSPNKNQNNSNTNQQTAPTLNYTGYEGKNQRLKDEYLKTFSKRETYNAYVKGENIKRTGVALAKRLSEGLDQINDEISSSNPEDILKEFNEKMQNIERLEAQFNEQNREYSFNAGGEIGNSLGNGDWESGLHQLASFFNAGAEQREARKAMEAKKQALYQQRLNKMSKIYWKAVDFNKAQRERYLRAAAYSKNRADEAYNLAFVENLDCFLQKMKNNFSSSNTYWLINDCTTPQKPKQQIKLNTGAKESENFIDIADRKFKIFHENEADIFRNAAITYASAAVKENPKPEYFLKLADYYRNYSNLLEYVSLLSAKEFSKNPSNDLKKRIKDLNYRVEVEANYALDNNNIDYINTFLNAELDKVVKIDDKDILNYAIENDKAEAVLTILNYRNKNESQKGITQNLNNALMLCAIENSPKTITSFINNGVSVNTKVNGQTPLEVANELMSVEAYEVLLKASNTKSNKTNKGLTGLLSLSKKDTKTAAEDLDSRSDQEIMELIDFVLNINAPKTEYLNFIGTSQKVKSIVKSNETLKKRISIIFFEELQKDIPYSKAHVIIQTGLLSFDSMPMYSDVVIQENQGKKVDRPLSYEEEIDLLIKNQTKNTLMYNQMTVSEAITKNMITQWKEEAQEVIKHYESIKGQDTKENQDEILTKVISVLKQNKQYELLRQYGFYYAQNLMLKKPYSMKDKVRLAIESDKRSKDQYSSDYSIIEREKEKRLKKYNDYLSGSGELSDNEKKFINSLFIYDLIHLDKRFDTDAVEEYFGIKINKNEGDISLAYYAWENNNPLLFHALDEKFDFSQKTGQNNTSLLERIVKKGSPGYYGKYYDPNSLLGNMAGSVLGGAKEQHERILKSFKSTLSSDNQTNSLIKKEISDYEKHKRRELFYSKDFDFESKSKDGETLLFIFLYNLINDASLFHEFKDIVSLYNIELKNLRMQDGGTVLHWYAKNMKDFAEYENLILDFGNYIKQFDIDSSIRDSKGQTAWDIFNANKDNIKDKVITDRIIKTKKYVKGILK